ncbi:uncharacterized protein LOC6580178 [Drosophila mojavensis]|uniref:MADF domain-containing protein n=1 Tax=Drosophila mojavensis TaxID=7230 RepID=B4KNC0_DROMO|nr:uncharacterized protein LOC6580178 [Drosophila mojavensis]EDW09973.1 uncharacterized protein Dmoj_GI20810 [Drosophila mojavensis]
MSAHHRPLDESDVMLIRTIRSTPSLYDHRHGDFRLSQRKEEDWAKVAKTLNISSPDARRRWTCLRDRYSRELKQMRLHPSSEFGRNEFFRQMDFLREFVRKRRERRRREDDDTPTNWLKAEVRTVKTKSRPVPDPLIEQDLDESQVYDDCDHNYDADAKLEVQTTQSESYSVLVEADDGDGHESYEEYMGDSESADQKVLPPLQPSPSLVTVHNDTPTAGNVSTSGASPSDAGHSQTDIEFMVCMPNMRVEAEHLPPIKPEASPGFEAVSAPATAATSASNETEDDYFCKSVAAYLRQLSRRHKIKAKVEMYQILEKYILLEESTTGTPGTSQND